MPICYTRSTSHVISTLMPSITLLKRTTALSMFPLYSSSQRQSLYLYDTVLVICLLWKSEQKLETLYISKYQWMACNKSSINNCIKYYYLLDQLLMPKKHTLYTVIKNHATSSDHLHTDLHIMTLLLFSNSSVIKKKKSLKDPFFKIKYILPSSTSV